MYSAPLCVVGVYEVREKTGHARRIELELLPVDKKEWQTSWYLAFSDGLAGERFFSRRRQVHEETPVCMCLIIDSVSSTGSPQGCGQICTMSSISKARLKPSSTSPVHLHTSNR